MQKTKKLQASILAVTMIILGIMIITALSVSMVSIKERKASMGEAKSGQAFQNAQSGIELVMQQITKGGHDTVGDICTTSAYTDISSGYKVVLKDENDVELNCTTDASDPVSEIASIKSIGTGSGQQRAIEAAVASGVVTGSVTGSCAFGNKWGTATDCSSGSLGACESGNRSIIITFCETTGNCVWNNAPNTYPMSICIKE